MADAPPTRHLLVVDDEADSADMLAELPRLALPHWEAAVAYGGPGRGRVRAPRPA